MQEVNITSTDVYTPNTVYDPQLRLYQR